MYTIKLDDELFKKAKGVPTHKVKKHITFDQYYETLMENKKSILSSIQFEVSIIRFVL